MFDSKVDALEVDATRETVSWRCLRLGSGGSGSCRFFLFVVVDVVARKAEQHNAVEHFECHQTVTYECRIDYCIDG